MPGNPGGVRPAWIVYRSNGTEGKNLLLNNGSSFQRCPAFFFFCLFFFNVKDSLPGKSLIQNESECKNKSELERGKIR